MSDDQLLFWAIVVLAVAGLAWFHLRSEKRKKKQKHNATDGLAIDLNDIVPGPENERGDPFASQAGGTPLVIFSGDGVTSINTGSGVIKMNAPTEDPDPDPPVVDPLDVAERVVAERGREHDPRFVDSLFVDALTVLGRADQRWGTIGDRGARSLAELVPALDVDDKEAAFRLLREREVSGAEAAVVDAFLGPRWPVDTAELLLQAQIPPRVALCVKVARVDPALCARMLEPLDAKDAFFRAGAALLAALDEGKDAPELAKSFDSSSGLERIGDREDWEELELRRLSRVDLDQAIDLFERLRVERGAPTIGTRALLRRLAQADQDRALTLAEPYVDEGEPFDRLPYVLGLCDGGLDMREQLGQLRAGISPVAYRPAAVFGALVEHFIHAGDPENLKATLRTGGAHGWQVTIYADAPLRELATRDAEVAEQCLALCLEPVEPGAIASRDASAGLAAGHVMHRPRWLQLKKVHPLEVLVLSAALAQETPRWYPDSGPPY